MKALTNNYNQCRLIRLDENATNSPFAVLQEGYDAKDPTMRMSFYWLQRDGTWVEDIARTALPEGQKFDSVFENVTDAMNLLASLSGEPQIERIPLTAEVIEQHIATLKNSSIEALMRQFLASYRAHRSAQP